jgi:hypothetical protein
MGTTKFASEASKITRRKMKKSDVQAEEKKLYGLNT